jgi:hypothetical protein
MTPVQNRSVRDDAVLSARAIERVGFVKCGQKAIAFDRRMEEINASPGRSILLRDLDGWAAELAIQFAGQMK